VCRCCHGPARIIIIIITIIIIIIIIIIQCKMPGHPCNSQKAVPVCSSQPSTSLCASTPCLDCHYISCHRSQQRTTLRTNSPCPPLPQPRPTSLLPLAASVLALGWVAGEGEGGIPPTRVGKDGEPVSLGRTRPTRCLCRQEAEAENAVFVEHNE
jgi:hypothetical protein